MLSMYKRFFNSIRVPPVQKISSRWTKYLLLVGNDCSGLQWHCCAFKWPISWKLTEFLKFESKIRPQKSVFFAQNAPFHCAIRHLIYWSQVHFQKGLTNPVSLAIPGAWSPGTRSGRFYDKSNFSFFICSFQFQLNSKKKFQFAHFTLLFAYTLLNFYSTRSKIEANLLAYLLCSLKISK